MALVQSYAGFDPTKESYYPPIIGNASQGGAAASWFHLQYLQLNKHSGFIRCPSCLWIADNTEVKHNTTKYKLAQSRAYGSKDWRIDPLEIILALPSHYRQMILGVRLELAKKSGVGYNQASESLGISPDSEKCWTQAMCLMRVILPGLMPRATQRYKLKRTVVERLWEFTKGLFWLKVNRHLLLMHAGFMLFTLLQRGRPSSYYKGG